MGENYTPRSSLISDLIGCLKYSGKGLGMWFECEQPFLPGEPDIPKEAFQGDYNLQDTLVT